ncbi:MAG: tRNA uridine(34) 5-carboxymethylaminomethyl modification radical SAM/GNAT enzyme Elp3 [Candidatus Falkowbacteria bacterium]|nr:tRNA uridine(34) 5-carboxymethylaminomethyl modification radical SAM/GNAT enzyme Elp3 [Candidatus Falkowbacteria bacterium]
MIKVNPEKLAIKELLTYSIGSIKDLEEAKRLVAKKYKISTLLNAAILEEYRRVLVLRKNKNKVLERILRKRSVRTLSGIAPVAVLTKSYPCPGHCVYCPNEKDVPVSYLSNEPAVMRAIRCQYDPYKQVTSRLKALENNGHEPTKIELIVIGGTWSYLPVKYKYWYILNCFKAANDYEKNKKSPEIKKLKAPVKKSLKLEDLKRQLIIAQNKNEKAGYKIIGLTLETRPDYINPPELLEMRALGCTRVEIGVQAPDDRILSLNKRGHGVKEIIEATKLLKEYGFKVTYHLMPALPGATPAKDLILFKKLFNDSNFQPDQIKFYPTIVTRGSLLYRWYKQGKYKPYSDKVLQSLIIKCKALVPEYVRIIRLIRDIPGESIIAGNKITNLRQIMKDQGVKCRCIRCREVKESKLIIKDYHLKTIKYAASGGREYFVQAEAKDGKILYGFCRLRIDKNSPIAPAIIRELHVYGELVSIGSQKKTQHSGLGKELMKQAEKLALENKAVRLAVISGVGARGYYKKLGYNLLNSYMIKENVN